MANIKFSSLSNMTALAGPEKFVGLQSGVATIGTATQLKTFANVPAGSNTQVQFNDSSVFGGDPGMTYDKTTNVLSLSGPANTLDLAGSATTAPVTLTASGSDADIIVKVAPKGLGYIQAGPDTYGIAGWGAYVGLELYTISAPHQIAQGIYVELNAANIAGASATGFSSNANTAGNYSGGTQDVAVINGGEFGANAYLQAGKTLTAARGFNTEVFNVGAGTITDAFGARSRISALHGTITNAYGLYSTVETAGGDGIITNAYGIRVLDITIGATLNYSCYFGAGKYHFDALTASQIVLTDGSKNLISAGVKPTITGSRSGNTALADLLTKLAALGLIVDGTS